MTKVIKGEFEKIKDVKVKDVPLTCDAPLEVFNNEVSRLSGMDDDLFTYEVEVANIPCDSKMDDDSEQEADDDMGYDPSDTRGDAKVELTDEESSDDMDEVAEVFRIDTNLFNFETPIPMKITGMIGSMNGTRTYHGLMRSHGLTLDWRDDGYCNGGNLPRTYISELKDLALRNKAIMEWLINVNDDESRYERRRRWNVYTNYVDAYEINHDIEEREELCEIHELSVCNIRRFEIIKYSFGQDEEYVAIKEDEYGNFARTSEDACRAYQEIFRIIDKGWMVTRDRMMRS
ncbi:hypothetical protein Tco_1495550 [Tanacetum coccineum]